MPQEFGDQAPPNFQMRLVEQQKLVKKRQLERPLRSEINQEELNTLKK